MILRAVHNCQHYHFIQDTFYFFLPFLSYDLDDHFLIFFENKCIKKVGKVVIIIFLLKSYNHLDSPPPATTVLVLVIMLTFMDDPLVD